MQSSENPEKIPFTLESQSLAVIDRMDIPPKIRRVIGVNEPANNARLNIPHPASTNRTIGSSSKTIYGRGLTND